MERRRAGAFTGAVLAVLGRLGAVLVRRHDPRTAPFRDATLSDLVARVPG